VLAALLGLSAVVVGGIAGHRKDVLFEGVVASGVAVLALAVVAGASPRWESTVESCS
jgi:hypothetical protein